MSEVTREQDLDCGSHCCRFAVKKTGMRTNGRCTCVDRLLSTIFEKTQRIAQLEETVSTLTRRDAEQQQREENWQRCFQEFKDLANGKERKYEQIHAVVLKDKIAQLEAEVARLNKVMDPIDQEMWRLGGDVP